MRSQLFTKKALKFKIQSQRLLDILTASDVQPRRVANICEHRPPLDVQLISSGVINSFWQEWNKLCRAYWECFIFGGDLSSSSHVISARTVVPINVSSNKGKTIYNFLEPTNRSWRVKCPKGSLSESQEPPWGSKRSLSEISSFYLRYYREINQLTGGLSMIGDVIEHVQIVRNAAIHMNGSTCELVKNIYPSYAFSRKIEYPTDYLYGIEVRTGKKAIHYWIDEITTLADIMCS